MLWRASCCSRGAVAATRRRRSTAARGRSESAGLDRRLRTRTARRTSRLQGSRRSRRRRRKRTWSRSITNGSIDIAATYSRTGKVKKWGGHAARQSLIERVAGRHDALLREAPIMIGDRPRAPQTIKSLLGRGSRPERSCQSSRSRPHSRRAAAAAAVGHYAPRSVLSRASHEGL